MPFGCLVGGNATLKSNSRKRIQMKNVLSRGRSHIAPETYNPPSLPSSMKDDRWENLPPELLLDIIQRVEAGGTSWPGRRDLVACAAVCKLWRDTTKEVVKTPEQCGFLTFPMSLKQPGPRNEPIQCFIRRDRANSTYRLYLGLSPALAGDASKMLLAAKKVKKATKTEFLISLSANGFSRASNTYVGKLSSNFLGTKFKIYDAQPSYTPAIDPKLSLKKASSNVVSSKVASVAYELNVLRTKGPRRMHCTMNSIPSSAVHNGGTAPTPPTFAANKRESVGPVKPVSDKSDPLVLKNKAPRWHEQLQCWCLNFKGRVTVASVKNFQLAVAQQDGVILQFGKIGRDIFTMDYCYPLSAFQAFAICLSSFDTKPACE